MSGLKASKQQKSNFKRPEPLDAGGYPGRLVRVIDLGLQAQQAYQGKDKPPAHMINVTYELSDEFLKNEAGEEMPDKPRWVSEEFTLQPLTSDLANSTKRYNILDPSGSFDGDWVQCLSAPCMINIVQNPSKKTGVVYEKVVGITALNKKMLDKLPPLVNETKYFDLTDPDIELFKSFPQFIQDKITANLEFAGSPLEKLLKDSPTPAAKQEKAAPAKAAEAPAEDESESSDTPW